ncbi:hypothetical protein C5167_044672 [Papaver somniferum]|nr:hypothetical protein C5167_044672 [Papaver somniferum]
MGFSNYCCDFEFGILNWLNLMMDSSMMNYKMGGAAKNEIGGLRRKTAVGSDDRLQLQRRWSCYGYGSGVRDGAGCVDGLNARGVAGEVLILKHQKRGERINAYSLQMELKNEFKLAGVIREGYEMKNGGQTECTALVCRWDGTAGMKCRNEVHLRIKCDYDISELNEVLKHYSQEHHGVEKDG